MDKQLDPPDFDLSKFEEPLLPLRSHPLEPTRMGPRIESKTEGLRPNEGGWWSGQDHQRLVELVRQGASIEQIAQRLGRTEGGVRKRMVLLLPPDEGVTPRGALDALRQHLADPGYDWEAVFASHGKQNSLWSVREERLAADAYARGEPGLIELSHVLNRAEPEVAKKIAQFDPGRTVADVAQRLGCTPGGTVDRRARAIRGEDPGMVWVLLRQAEDDVYVTLHPDRAEALEALNEHMEKSGRSFLWRIGKGQLDGYQKWVSTGSHSVRMVSK